MTSENQLTSCPTCARKVESSRYIARQRRFSIDCPTCSCYEVEVRLVEDGVFGHSGPLGPAGSSARERASQCLANSEACAEVLTPDDVQLLALGRFSK